MGTDIDDGSPLRGVVVVSLEQAISAPFATRQLADLGATVIKVERPEGDFARHYDTILQGQSVFFVWANRGKQSVVLDLKDGDQRATFDALVAGADVFLHNLSPRAAADLRVDAATLTSAHPSLIAVEISGYGRGGPRDDDKAYDLAIQAESGVFSVTGGEEMSKVGFSVADICAGMYALTSVLAALVRRDRTGHGAAISVSMLDSLAEWMSAPLYNTVYSGAQPPRTGRRHHAIAPYGTYRLADGHEILLAVQNDEEWRRLAEQVLGDPGLAVDGRFATNAQRIAHVSDVDDLVGGVLAAADPDDVMTRLSSARIATARVNDLAALWQHEQLRSRDRFVSVDTPGGPVEMLAAPFDISGWVPPTGRVPALGEHDEDVLRDLLDDPHSR